MASLSSSAASQPLSTNFARIGYAAQQMFPDILQELMTIKEPPHRLSHDVNNNWYLSNKLRPDEWLLINNVSTKGYTDFDIPFIYKLVRNLKLLPPPTRGWNHSSVPCPTEITAGDDLERIRRLRNEILHRGNAQVTDSEFLHFFTQFKDIAGRLETYLGKQAGEFVHKIIHLEKCCIDEETNKIYIRRLDSLKKSDEDCKERLKALEKDVDALKLKKWTMIHTKPEDLARTQDEVIPQNIRGWDENKRQSTGARRKLVGSGRSQRVWSSFLREDAYATQEQFARHMQQWTDDDKKFVSTKAEKKVMESILTRSCVTIVGNPGTGKSFLSRHVALKMMAQDYIIIPCGNPEDIRQWFKYGRKTLFVFDDVCGRYTFNQQIFKDWKQRMDHIKSLLKDKCCKIMSTCRLDVYKDEKFRSLSIFKMCNIDLSSAEFRLISAERFALAKMYMKENNDFVDELSEKYDFFPLLCSLYQKQKLDKIVSIRSFFNNPFNVFKDELENLYIEGDDGKMKYCGLVLCVMFNNTLTEDNLSHNDKELAAVVEDLLVECELNKGTSVKRLKKSLEILEGTFVVIENSTYKIIHDKLFDILAKNFGEKMLRLFIDHSETDFICERFLWRTPDNTNADIEFGINISENQINRYIGRMLKDWEHGYIDNVFMNRNMNSPTFTEKIINYINKFDRAKQEELACKQDIFSTDIALGGSCYMGTVNLVKWLICRKSNINYCTQDGYFPLLWASQEGHSDVVKELLRHSAEVNKCKNNGVSPLYISSENGHLDVVKELIQHSADVNKCSNEGISPLHIACCNNRIEVVHVLLQCDDIDIDLCDDDDRSSIYWASQKGHVDVVRELLQHSAAVNKCKTNGVSALYIASQNGHLDVVKELLQHSADVNKCSNDGIPPLQIACFNSIEVLNVLLQCDDVDIDICDDDGCSSLYWASHKGHLDVVKELLKHSAEVNKCNYYRVSPLFVASENGHCNVITVLLQHSAEVNKCRSNGTTPLQIACYTNKIEVVNLLLQCDAVDIDLCDDDGRSSIYLASQKGHVDVVNELLNHSATVNTCDHNGMSPLFIASENGHIDVVKQLLRYSPDVNKCSNDGTPPLQIACYKNRIEVVQVLLQFEDIDIDLCDEDGCTSLYWASKNGHIEVVKELIQNSVAVNKCKNNGMSPLYVASQNGNIEVVKELIQHSADVNKCSYCGISPSWIACFNSIEVLNVLLRCDNVDINLCDDDGCSLLYWASRKGQVDAVKELLQHSAAVNKCSNNGVSPLSIASENGHVDVVKELIQHSADVNKCDNDCVSPLCTASQKGQVDVVKELLHHFADVNNCNTNGVSPLWQASQNGHVNVVKELLHHSADVNKCRHDGTSPLQIACNNNMIEVVRVLLQCGNVDVHLCDNDGCSSLYFASKEGHIDVVKILLQHSADVNYCVGKGKSPILIANDKGHDNVVKKLLKHLADVNTSDDDGSTPL